MQVLIIGIAAYWFASLSRIPDYIKGVLFRFGISKEIPTPINFDSSIIPARTTIRLYPFDCEKCLSFWLGIIYFPFTFDGVLLSFCASFVAIVTGLLMNKLR